MKKFFTLSVFLLLTRVLLAQAPQGINYQGVARNAGGAPYNNQLISVRLTVRSGTPTGTLEYSEVRSATTNAFGLFTLQIGSTGAESTTGNFTTINWNNGSRFLQTEIKLPGQATFTDMGTTQMMSVPYAISSLQARQLSLPFDTTVNTNTSNKGAFQIKNTSLGQYEAIKGESVNGSGIVGFSEKKGGVYGTSAAAAQAGVLGNNATNGGYGVMGALANSNTDGIAVYGMANFGTGVKGQSVVKTGVTGESTNAAGVAGQSVNHHGVTGTTNAAGKAGVHGMVSGASGNQIGVYGEAFNTATGVVARNANLNGLALDVQGKLKIAGNGQTPGAGRVLTSDAQGNATWQNPVTPAKVGFSVKGIATGGQQNLPNGQWYKYHGASEVYDPGNNYTMYNQGTADLPASSFTAPVSGFYHFESRVKIAASGGSNWISSGNMRLVVKRNGEIIELAKDETFPVYEDIQAGAVWLNVSINNPLLAGDQVWVELLVNTTNNTNPTFSAAAYPDVSRTMHFFSGYLIHAN